MRTVTRYRIALVREGEETVPARANLSTPRGVYRFLQALLGASDREEFLVLALNSRNVLLGYNVASVGSLSASIVHPREVYKSAILLNAAAIVVGHNHPSGDPAPSREDREVTRTLSEAGRLLDIPLHDLK
jgi:DNA repair protein RadC